MNNYEWADNYEKLYEIIVDIQNRQATPPAKKARKESYYSKVERLAKTYPAVAAAKAHLDELVALVEHGE